MSDDRPKIRRYRNPRYDVSAGDMSLWEALRDHASTADEDPARVAGHRFSAGEVREVLDTIAQLRWDLLTAQRELAIAQASSGIQRGAKEVAEGAATATMLAMQKAKQQRDEARAALRIAVTCMDELPCAMNPCGHRLESAMIAMQEHIRLTDYSDAAEGEEE